MKVAEVMSRDVRVARPDQSLREVAGWMAEIDAGAIPVGENDRLVGMVTDRDIAVRAVAAGKGPDTPVRDVMTPDIRYVFDDADLDETARNMAQEKVRRMPVVNREKRLVGILSVGDMATKAQGEAANEVVSGVSQPGGQRSQSQGSKQKS